VNKKIFIVLLMPVFLVQCSSIPFVGKFFRSESKFFTEGEKVVLSQTTKAIGYNFSFDPDLKLDYIYSNSSDVELAKKKEKDFKKVLESFKKEEITSFYEKIYRLKLLLTYTMEEAKKDKDWNDYTLIKKYILPGFTVYYDMLERNVYKIVPEYKETAVKKKALIEGKVKKEFD